MKTNLKSVTVAAAALLLGAVSMSSALADAGAPSSRDDVSRAPTQPGGDPPYDPGWGPSDLSNPWQPPTGPGDLSDTPTTRPDGPGDYSDAPPPPFDPARRVAEVPPGCAGGKMIDYSYRSGEWLPSSAWKVHVWVFDGKSGGKVQRYNQTRLDVNGEWTICGTPADYGNTIVTAYAADNGRLRLEDIRQGENGWMYWGSGDGLGAFPPQDGIYVNGHNMPASPADKGVVLPTWTLHTGPEFVDGKPNPLYGIGDIMRWGTAMLDKLAAKGLRGDRSALNGKEVVNFPHEIHYPLTEAECADTVSACYDSSFNYVLLDHSHVDPFTVDHELAHSVVDEYWGYDPAGGPHSKNECEAGSNLAYSEGVANYIGVWAQNTDFGYEAETDPFNIRKANVPACDFALGDTDGGKGSHSEVYIAGALWDFHDQDATDDPNWPTLDTLGETGSGADLVKIILENPVAHAPALRLLLENMWPQHKTWISAVFGYNNIGFKTPQY